MFPKGSVGMCCLSGVRTVTCPHLDDAPYFRGSVVVLGVLIGDAERLNMRVTDRDGHVVGPLVGTHPSS